MVGAKSEVVVIWYLPAAPVKQVGSRLPSASPRLIRGILLMSVRAGSRSSLINRWRSQEDEICFERSESIFYSGIEN